MNWYYFKHKGMTLAPIYAKNEKEARKHFERMNKETEPLKVLKVSKV